MNQPPESGQAETRRRFRRNLILVMGVQVITLIALWLIQRHFSS